MRVVHRLQGWRRGPDSLLSRQGRAHHKPLDRERAARCGWTQSCDIDRGGRVERVRCRQPPLVMYARRQKVPHAKSMMASALQVPHHAVEHR
jgi:hypothetical protein